MVFCVAMNENALAADASALSYSACNGGVMVTNCDKSASGELVIPDQYNGQNVVQIGAFAFDNCMNLTKVVIPEGVIAIGESAFEGCMSLKNVEFPESLQSIGAFAFFCCDSLEKVQLYPYVCYIGECAFYECISLKSVNIPSSLTTICDGTFAECSSLSKITIENTLKSVGVDAFYNCNNLKEVHYRASLYSWAIIDFADGNDKIISRSTENFNHKHSFTLKITVQPDCTQYGKATYDCNCGYIFNDTVTPKGHIEVPLEAVSPTCTESGKTSGIKCSSCQVIVVPQTIIPAIGHKEIVSEAVAATCISTGLTKGSYCDTCHEVFSVQTVVPMTEHTINWIYTEDATCVKEGIYTGYCTYCSESFVKNMPTTDHYFPNGATNCVTCGLERAVDCRCLCHKTGLWSIPWKIIKFVIRLFKFMPTCSCGAPHYYVK